MLTVGVIGDFGIKSTNSVAVSNLVKSWNPDIILTTGDNLYSPPSQKNYSSIIGVLYPEYLDNLPHFVRGGGINSNSNNILRDISKKWKGRKIYSKFFPCVGNHDFPFTSYTNYFQLPTFYSVEFTQPKKHLLKVISLNNYKDEEHGRFDDATSNQRSWLEEELEASQDFDWILVTFHYPQLCSNSSREENETNSKRLFPFYKYQNVGLVLSGHQHIYERLEVNGVTNVVVGTSGHSVRRKSIALLEESRQIDDSGFGAVRLDVSKDEIKGGYVVLENIRGRNKKQTVIKDEFSVIKKR
ncbi:probable purple acid phosphatase 20 [Folsomia candida]|uniref:Purple acid phosphatase 2 n=1 Tax=Folsomia candida TaxID=158441 RepID=A0A226F5W8_FOLCA|nr:probable purple acid phosphatase 20 [Folsomia candida]OXA64276.1 Purple acid phosphatase 2 [Folsomia candida]